MRRPKSWWGGEDNVVHISDRQQFLVGVEAYEATVVGNIKLVGEPDALSGILCNVRSKILSTLFKPIFESVSHGNYLDPRGCAYSVDRGAGAPAATADQSNPYDVAASRINSGHR